ncbi:unnamed protein product [Phytomonas sp. EM1]|nr:unnamed protein product [Phytomonas sp. EM1]|eukprot:CCW61826.1 unnamed protein product [Phytomonas sp. isolate EM1]
MPFGKSCVRLCSAECLFSNKEARSDQEHLSGVILLNSPENAQWSCKEYFRLWKLYRGKRHASSPLPKRPICYFICADGAYDALLHYYYTHYDELCDLGLFPDGHGKSRGTGETVPLPPFPLCDIVIGDMDSSNRFKKYINTSEVQDQPRKDSSQTEHLAFAQESQLPFLVTGGWYNHVKEIPCEMLGKIRLRALALARGGGDGGYPVLESTLPYLFPITCQMTTDFSKSMLILRRLKRRYPCDFPEYYDDGAPLWRDPSNKRRPFIDRYDDANDDDEMMTEEERDAAAPTAPLVQAIIQRFGDAMRSLIDSHEALSKVMPQHEEQRDELRESFEGVNDAEAKRLENMRCANLLNEVWKNSVIGRREGGNAYDTLSLHTCILPSVAILGSLGGRLDQEIASVSSLFNFESEFHMILTNKWNVMFPCATNGVTLWLHPSPDADKPGGVEGFQQPVLGDPNDITSKTNDKGGCGQNVPSSTGKRAQQLDREGDLCGIVPFGFVQQMETTGFLYNIVKGRSGPPWGHYDGVTQTEQFVFSFSGIVSTSNTAVAPMMLVDMRILSHTDDDKNASYDNPPTLLTTNRLTSS